MRHRILPGVGSLRGVVGGVEGGGEPRTEGTSTSGRESFGCVEDWVYLERMKGQAGLVKIELWAVVEVQIWLANDLRGSSMPGLADGDFTDHHSKNDLMGYYPRRF